MRITSAFMVAFALLSTNEQLFAAYGDSLRASVDYDKSGLQLHVFLTGDKAFFDRWNEPVVPKIVTSSSYKRGEHIFPVILFSTDNEDEHVITDLSYDITIIKPDGSVYADFKQLVIVNAEPAIRGTMYLLRQHVDVGLEEKDPLGIYRVQVVVFENLKKIRVTFELVFEVNK